MPLLGGCCPGWAPQSQWEVAGGTGTQSFTGLRHPPACSRGHPRVSPGLQRPHGLLARGSQHPCAGPGGQAAERGVIRFSPSDSPHQKCSPVMVTAQGCGDCGGQGGGHDMACPCPVSPPPKPERWHLLPSCGTARREAVVTSVMSEAILCPPRSIPFIPLSPFFSAWSGLCLEKVGWVVGSSAGVSFPAGRSSLLLIKDVTPSWIPLGPSQGMPAELPPPFEPPVRISRIPAPCQHAGRGGSSYSLSQVDGFG